MNEWGMEVLLEVAEAIVQSKLRKATDRWHKVALLPSQVAGVLGVQCASELMKMEGRGIGPKIAIHRPRHSPRYRPQDVQEWISQDRAYGDLLMMGHDKSYLGRYMYPKEVALARLDLYVTKARRL